MTVLYLTTAERPLYERLSSDVREGWTVEEETGVFEDTAQKRAIRLSMIRLHDKKLLALRDHAMQAPTLDAVADLLNDNDLKDVDEDDIAELFFALGPESVSRLIIHMLLAAKIDRDVEGVCALTTIRHAILRAFQPV